MSNDQVTYDGLTIPSRNSLKLMEIMGLKITFSVDDRTIHFARFQDPDLPMDFTEMALNKETAFTYGLLRIGMNKGIWF